MKISKKEALIWFRFFAELQEELSPRQMEIALAVLSQIELAAEERFRKAAEGIPVTELEGRTRFVGPGDKFPRGCRSCLLGTGLSAVRRTNKCNMNCPFCYDFGVLDQIEPIGEGYFEIGGGRYRVEDLPLLFTVSKRPTGIAYVYLEPFMEIEVYYDIISAFAKEGIHQHMYTNGTLATEENLKALGEAGLPELRFNLGASLCSDKVIENMAIAKRYIPQVGIETPMTPQFLSAFEKKKQRILDTGIDFMNCAEVHLNPNNCQNYAGENLYMYRGGYISPIFSREITCQMMREAWEEKWPLCVHDCSNRTKFARDLNLRAHEGGWFGATSYAPEFDSIPFELFLPVLEDPDFAFLEEEEMPEGYRLTDIVL